MPEEILRALANKVLHDLSTPVNALTLGLEMLSEIDYCHKTQMALSESGKDLHYKIQLFKEIINFQRKDPFCSLKILKDYLAHKKILWKNPIPEIKGKINALALCIGYIGVESLPRGGELTFKYDGEKQPYSLYVSGDYVCLRPDYRQAFVDKNELLSSRNALAHYACYLAGLLGRKIIIKETSQELFIGF